LITNKTASWEFDSYDGFLAIRTNLIINIHLLVFFIQTYGEVPHLRVETGFAIGAFHTR
jgi:hypothetical protein